MFSAEDFQQLVQSHEQESAEEAQETRRERQQQDSARVKALIDSHIGDEAWRNLLHRAREAAEKGAKDFELIRFPSTLCTDGARAINAPEEGWESTLRGEPAEIYQRWEKELKPHGFHLSARVLTFPDGFPGDVGLFLSWMAE